jgi:hypothetical protein
MFLMVSITNGGHCLLWHGGTQTDDARPLHASWAMPPMHGFVEIHCWGKE